MSVFTDLRTAANRVLSELGDPVTVRRYYDGYNPAERKVVQAAPLEQVLRGTIYPPGQSDKRLPDSFTRTYARIGLFSPEPMEGDSFEPQVGDIVDDSTDLWRVAARAIEKRQGVVMLYTLGLDAA